MNNDQKIIAFVKKTARAAGLRTQHECAKWNNGGLLFVDFALEKRGHKATLIFEVQHGNLHATPEVYILGEAQVQAPQDLTSMRGTRLRKRVVKMCRKFNAPQQGEAMVAFLNSLVA